MNRETAIVFDFGGVICFFDYRIAWERFGRPLGLSGAALQKLLDERGFVALHHQFEEGKLAPEEFAARVGKLAGLEMTFDEFADGWRDIFRLNEPVARLIEHLKGRGHRLLLGSNTNVLHSTHVRRAYARPIGLLDELVLSHEVGHMKPDRRFYEACVAAAGAPAGSCVFIDDLPANVAAARAAGLKAVQYRDAPALIEDLRRLGVDVTAQNARHLTGEQ